MSPEVSTLVTAHTVAASRLAECLLTELAGVDFDIHANHVAQAVDMAMRAMLDAIEEILDAREITDADAREAVADAALKAFSMRWAKLSGRGGGGHA